MNLLFGINMYITFKYTFSFTLVQQQLDIFKAAREGNLDEVQQCLTAGMDVDMQDDVSYREVQLLLETTSLMLKHLKTSRLLCYSATRLVLCLFAFVYLSVRPSVQGLFLDVLSLMLKHLKNSRLLCYRLIIQAVSRLTHWWTSWLCESTGSWSLPMGHRVL